MGVGGEQGADNLVVDEPVDLVLGPLNGVGVGAGERSTDGVEGTTVVGGGVALAEVVGLDLLVVTTNPLQINLVEIVRLEDSAGNNTSTLGSLNGNINTAEHDVLVGLDGGGVGGLLDREDGTLSVGLDVGTLKSLELLAEALGEVAVDLLITESGVGLAA